MKIFETIEMLISKGLLANPITLKNYFENNEGLKELEYWLSHFCNYQNTDFDLAPHFGFLSKIG